MAAPQDMTINVEGLPGILDVGPDDVLVLNIGPNHDARYLGAMTEAVSTAIDAHRPDLSGRVIVVGVASMAVLRAQSVRYATEADQAGTCGEPAVDVDGSALACYRPPGHLVRHAAPNVATRELVSWWTDAAPDVRTGLAETDWSGRGGG